MQLPGVSSGRQTEEVSYTRAFYVRFHCEDTRCACDVDVRVHGCVTEDGGRLYEYSSSTCPRCGHPLFRTHAVVGEVRGDNS